MTSTATTSVALIVFVKPPNVGRMPTRLAMALGKPSATRLAAAFLRDTVAMVRALPSASSAPTITTTISLCVAAPWQAYEAADPGLADALIDLPRWPQGEGDLGQRMERALRRGLEGADCAILLGADAPGLPIAHLQAALRNLDDADCVFGPALDGGYYLIGLRRCPEGCLADLPWGTADSLQASLGRFFSLGFAPTVAPSYFNIDARDDLRTFSEGVAAGLWRAPHTEATLAALGADALAAATAPEIIGA